MLPGTDCFSKLLLNTHCVSLLCPYFCELCSTVQIIFGDTQVKTVSGKIPLPVSAEYNCHRIFSKTAMAVVVQVRQPKQKKVGLL